MASAALYRHDGNMETTTPPPPSSNPPNDGPNDGPNDRASGANDGPDNRGHGHSRGYRRLTRSRDDRMIGGVASGIAQTYGFDVALVRVACAVIALFTFGTAVGAYVIAWLLIPEARSESIAHSYLSGRGRGRGRGIEHRSKVKFWIAIVLLVIGIDALGDIWADGWSRFFGPMVLITIGVAILVSRRDDETRSATDTFSTHADDGVDVDDDETDWHAERQAERQPWPTRPHRERAFNQGVQTDAPHDGVHRADLRTARRTARMERRQARSHLTGLTLSVLMLLIGGAWLIDSANVAQVTPGAVQAIALCVIGISLIVSAWYGRARALIPIAFVLTMSCAVVAALDVPLSGGVGERKHAPSVANGVKTRYQLGVGHLVVDLTNVQGTDAISTEVVEGIGGIEVLVPTDANVFVTSHVGVGEMVILGTTHEGLYREQRTAHSQGTGQTIRLNIRLGLGEIRVRRSSPPVDERSAVVIKPEVAQ